MKKIVKAVKRMNHCDKTIWAQMTAHLLMILFVYTFMLHLKNNIQLDQSVYKHVGMMEINDGDRKIYSPVYQRVR